MNARDVVSMIVLVLSGVAAGFGVWAFLEMAKSMRSVRRFSDEARERVMPLLEKADVTVDAVNAELLRIDAIVTRFEEAGERVSSASGTIHDIVNAPTEIVSGVATRVRNAWKGRRHAAPEPADAATDRVPTGATTEMTSTPTNPVEGDG